MRLKEFKANLDPTSGKQNLSSHKDVLNKLLVGNIQSNFKNRGYEFEDYRSYSPSDDAERIDWKASLRSNELLIRETIEEKAVNVLFLLDISDSMLFSSNDKLKCEFAAEIVSELSFAIQREGNAIGMSMFNEKLVKSFPPMIGTGQYYDMINELKNVNNYGGKSNLKNAIKYSLSFLKVPSLVVIISDFIDIGEDWEKYLSVISFKYDLIGICIKDVRDRKLPKNIGQIIIEDPTSEEKIMFDTVKDSERFNQHAKDEEEKLLAIFKKAKSECLILQSDEPYFNPLIRFLQKRAKMKI